MELDWAYELRGKEVLKYFKEQYGYVTGSYARKVLGVGETKFKTIKQQYQLEEFIYRAPTSSWDMKLYKLAEIKKIRDELNEQDQDREKT